MLIIVNFYAWVNTFWTKSSSVGFSSLINRQRGVSEAGAEWCHITGTPSLSRWQSKRDGSLGCTWGEFGRAECGTKCYQLSPAYADGIRHGWANLTVSKVHGGIRFSTCVNICESVCMWIYAGMHMCSHSWGERAYCGLTFPLDSTSFLAYSNTFPPSTALSLKLSKQIENNSSVCYLLL